MTNLPDLFDEAVSSAPPSRLTANDILTAAGTRRRRSIARLAGVTILAGILAAVAGLSLTGRSSEHQPVGGARLGPVVWAGRFDANHLFLITNVCGQNPMADPSAVPTAPGPRQPGCYRLSGSTDAGLHWTARSALSDFDMTVLGPQTLARFVAPAYPGPTTSTGEPANPAVELSTDGGVSWTAAAIDDTPIAVMPPLGRLIGYSTPQSALVFDPHEGRIRGLALRPPVSAILQVAFSQPDTLWAPGLDPVTGRPAVAVSHDGGATWTKRVMPETAPVDGAPPAADPSSGGQSYPVVLTPVLTRDNGTAYVTMYDPSRPPPDGADAVPGTMGWGWLRSFRTTDGGSSWTQTSTTTSTVPSFTQAWVTADGRLVLDLTDRTIAGATGEEFLVSSDGGLSFAVGAPPGLPADLMSSDGSVAYTQHAAYVSGDGWTWRQVWHD